VPVPPRVPEQLTHGPFTLADALRTGLSRRQLQSRSWRRLATGLYVWSGCADDPLSALVAASRRLPPGAVFSGRTAGWLHGIDQSPTEPFEATVAPGCGVSARTGLVLRRSALEPADVAERHGLPVTSAIRTTFDLARFLPLEEAVAAVDVALHARLVTIGDIERHAASRPTARGRSRARQVIDLSDQRSESPMESRLRVLLVRSGLPRPKAQVNVCDLAGQFIGRVDLYYPEQRLCLEYDGTQHRDRLAADNRRQNRLLAAGFRLLRFTAADLSERPAAVVAQVRELLRCSADRVL
jgi:very-short-patch-repair endonuclease